MSKILLVLLLFGSLLSKDLLLLTDNWEPYYGPDLKNGGYLAEIVVAAFKEVGVDVKVEFKPWKRVIKEVKDGDADGILGLYFKRERLKFLEYSEPIETTQVALFTLKDRDISYRNLYDLRNYKIGIVRGYSTTKEFDNASFLFKDEASTSNQNLIKLIHKRSDIIVDSRKVIEYNLSKYMPDKMDTIKIIDPPLQLNELYIAISKRNRNYLELTQKFNKGLKIIKENGVYDSIIENQFN